MDVNRVIGAVAARHGVRLDPDDPALVLVTVAEMMLADAREEFLGAARRATAEFVEAADFVQRQAGAAMAESLGSIGVDPRVERGRRGVTQPNTAGVAARRSTRYAWSVTVTVDGVLFVVGLAVGRWLA